MKGFWDAFQTTPLYVFHILYKIYHGTFDYYLVVDCYLMYIASGCLVFSSIMGINFVYNLRNNTTNISNFKRMAARNIEDDTLR